VYLVCFVSLHDVGLGQTQLNIIVFLYHKREGPINSKQTKLTTIGKKACIIISSNSSQNIAQKKVDLVGRQSSPV
jgi:hypothetical protein